jgi:hypothetical protein
MKIQPRDNEHLLIVSTMFYDEKIFCIAMYLICIQFCFITILLVLFIRIFKENKKINDFIRKSLIFLFYNEIDKKYNVLG